MGKDLVLGLEDDYAVAVQMSYVVPTTSRSLVVYRWSQIRATRALGRGSLGARRVLVGQRRAAD